MVILVEKFKIPFGSEDRSKNAEALSASLRDFRFKISTFIAQMLVRNKPTSEILSLTCLQGSFELIQVTNKAFAELVAEIDYPMSEWGGIITDQYLSYTLNFLDLLNSISSSLTHLNQVKVSNFLALKLLDNLPKSAAGHLKKIPRKLFNLGKDFMGARLLVGSDEKLMSKKERLVLEALMVVRRIEFLALGLVLSGLCSDCKPYLDVRKFVGGSEDSLVKSLDSVYGQEIMKMDGVMHEVKEVNAAIDGLLAALSAGAEGWGGAAMALKGWLERLEDAIQGFERKTNRLFSEVLATRNELLDSFRLSRQKS